MESLSKVNSTEVEEFIIRNLERSLFIYGNLNSDTLLLRFKRNNQNIVGLYLILNNKYITYLFDDLASFEDISEVVLDAQSFEHSEGTIVSPNRDIINKYYTIKNEEELTEVALLRCGKMQAKYKRVNSIKLLDLENKTEVKKYIESVKKVGFNYEQETFVDNYKDAKIYVLKSDKGEIISSATLTSISVKTAVVVGVFTLPEYQNMGNAKLLVEHLLAENTTSERNFFIFFNNPIAKKIYLKLGFEINNVMSMIEKK